MGLVALITLIAGFNLWSLYGNIPLTTIQRGRPFLERCVGSFQLASVVHLAATGIESIDSTPPTYETLVFEVNASEVRTAKIVDEIARKLDRDFAFPEGSIVFIQGNNAASMPFVDEKIELSNANVTVFFGAGPDPGQFASVNTLNQAHRVADRAFVLLVFALGLVSFIAATSTLQILNWTTERDSSYVDRDKPTQGEVTGQYSSNGWEPDDKQDEPKDSSEAKSQHSRLDNALCNILLSDSQHLSKELQRTEKRVEDVSCSSGNLVHASEKKVNTTVNKRMKTVETRIKRLAEDFKARLQKQTEGTGSQLAKQITLVREDMQKRLDDSETQLFEALENRAQRTEDPLKSSITDIFERLSRTENNIASLKNDHTDDRLILQAIPQLRQELQQIIKRETITTADLNAPLKLELDGVSNRISALESDVAKVSGIPPALDSPSEAIANVEEAIKRLDCKIDDSILVNNAVTDRVVSVEKKAKLMFRFAVELTEIREQIEDMISRTHVPVPIGITDMSSAENIYIISSQFSALQEQLADCTRLIFDNHRSLQTEFERTLVWLANAGVNKMHKVLDGFWSDLQEHVREQSRPLYDNDALFTDVFKQLVKAMGEKDAQSNTRMDSIEAEIKGTRLSLNVSNDSLTEQMEDLRKRVVDCLVSVQKKIIPLSSLDKRVALLEKHISQPQSPPSTTSLAGDQLSSQENLQLIDKISKNQQQLEKMSNTSSSPSSWNDFARTESSYSSPEPPRDVTQSSSRRREGARMQKYQPF